MSAVQNLPGIDDRKMDQLIALKAASEVVKPVAEYGDLAPYVREFKLWLDQASGDADKLYRRYVLLTVADSDVAELDAAPLRKLIDDIYRGI